MLAPADDDTPLPHYVVSAGRAGPGALQRLGGPAHLRPDDRRPGEPVDRARASSTSLHLHEPMHAGVVAAGAVGGRGPDRRDLPHLRCCARGRCRPPTRCCGPALEKISGRIAVSEDARRTVHDPPRRRRGRHPQRGLRRPVRRAVPRGRVEGTAAGARPSRSSAGSTSRARACRCCAGALPAVARRAPGPAGARRRPRRRAEAAEGGLTPRGRRRAASPRRVSDEDKAALLPRSTRTSRRTPAARASASCSIEAMSAGAPVVASDLPAFAAVLDGGAPG